MNFWAACPKRPGAEAPAAVIKLLLEFRTGKLNLIKINDFNRVAQILMAHKSGFVFAHQKPSNLSRHPAQGQARGVNSVSFADNLFHKIIPPKIKWPFRPGRQYAGWRGGCGCSRLAGLCILGLKLQKVS